MREERSEFLAAASVRLAVALMNMGIKQKEQIRAGTEGLWGRNLSLRWLQHIKTEKCVSGSVAENRDVGCR